MSPNIAIMEKTDLTYALTFACHNKEYKIPKILKLFRNTNSGNFWTL